MKIFPLFFLFIMSFISIFSQNIVNKEIQFIFNQNTEFQTNNNLILNENGLKLNAFSGAFESSVIQSPIENPEPFVAVAYKLYSNNIEEENFNVYFRISNDGNNWKDWTLLEVDHHGEIIVGEFSSMLQFFDKDLKYFQYKIELIQNKNISSPEIQELKLIFINPGATPAEKLQNIENIRNENNLDESKNSSNNGIENTYPRPAFVNRVQWACPYPTGYPGNPNWRPSVTTPTHLVVHHSAGSNSSSDWAAVVRSYWSLHVNTNGWSDIGYNWLVDATGVLYQGRQFSSSGSDNTVGAHFSGANGATMGVCVMGTYTSVSPSLQALKMLVRILAYKASERNINPRGISLHSGSNLTIYNICGHRDGPGSTECPGTNLWNQLPTIRNRVFALLNPPIVENTFTDSISENSAYVFGSVNPRTSQSEAYFQWGTTPEVIFNSPVVPIGNGNEFVPVSRALTQLQSSTKYYYRTVGKNSDTLTFGETKYFITMGIPLAVELLLPENESVIEIDSVLFVWNSAEPLAELYHFQVAEDSLFNSLILNLTLNDTFYIYNQIEFNKEYWWRVKGENSFGAGEFSQTRKFTTVVTSINDENNSIPNEFSLKQNFPNPFNPSTLIQYVIASDNGTKQSVSLKVYDIIGNEVATLVNEEKEAGLHQIAFDAKGLTSGIYFYKLTTGSFTETKKLILMK